MSAVSGQLSGVRGQVNGNVKDMGISSRELRSDVRGQVKFNVKNMVISNQEM